MRVGQLFQAPHDWRQFLGDVTSDHLMAFIAWMGYLLSGFAKELDDSYVENDPTITKTLEDFIDLMRLRVEEAEQLLVEVERRSERK